MSGAPKLGALGTTFAAMRAMQFVALVTVIGLTSNFISEIVAVGEVPPEYLVGTLVVVCIATLYIGITYILYYDNMLPLLAAAAADGTILVALIVVACVFGKPVSYLSCAAITSETGSAASFFATVSAIHPSQEQLWAAGDRASCFEAKAVWGLAVALCVLFAFSAVVAACLWRRVRTVAAVAAAAKDVEG